MVYVIVRKDIPLRMQLVQASHAAIQATTLFPSHEPNLVVLEVADQVELIFHRDRLKDAGIDCAAFYEPDNDLGYTAVGTGPLDAAMRRYMKGLRSWRE